jgi:uncharacterized protein YaiL (DUF2058 family)
MAKTLAEQLLGAGLIDKKKVDKARKEKRQQKKSGNDDAEAQRQRLQQQRAEQVERDRQLNQQRLAEEQARAVKAQVRQMLRHSQQKANGDIRFSFSDQRSGKVKQMYVSQAIQEQLARGQVAICADEERYVLIPRIVADKIAERDADAVIFLADRQKDAPAEDDPYKDYPIPDDLMW